MEVVGDSRNGESTYLAGQLGEATRRVESSEHILRKRRGFDNLLGVRRRLPLQRQDVLEVLLDECRVRSEKLGGRRDFLWVK